MTHFIIDSEHDIEFTVTYITDLVRSKSRSPSVELTFPSDGLAKCFMDNLITNFQANDIPNDIGLALKFYIPPAEEN